MPKMIEVAVKIDESHGMMVRVDSDQPAIRGLINEALEPIKRHELEIVNDDHHPNRIDFLDDAINKRDYYVVGFFIGVIAGAFGRMDRLGVKSETLPSYKRFMALQDRGMKLIDEAKASGVLP